MASPKKVDSIKMSVTTLNDPGLPITSFNRAELVSWLNGLSSPNVAFFFSGEGSDTGSANRLIIAASDASGNLSPTQQKASAELPCPPYCNR